MAARYVIANQVVRSVYSNSSLSPVNLALVFTLFALIIQGIQPHYAKHTALNNITIMSCTLNILWWIFISNCYPQWISFQSLRWRMLVCWRLCVRFQIAKTQTLNPDFHSLSLVNRYERQSPRRWVSRECNNNCEWGSNIDHNSVRKTLK